MIKIGIVAILTRLERLHAVALGADRLADPRGGHAHDRRAVRRRLPEHVVVVAVARVRLVEVEVDGMGASAPAWEKFAATTRLSENFTHATDLRGRRRFDVDAAADAFAKMWSH